MKTYAQLLKSRADYFRVQKNTFKELAFYLEDIIHLIETVREENLELKRENYELKNKNNKLTEKILLLEKMLEQK